MKKLHAISPYLDDDFGLSPHYAKEVHKRFLEREIPLDILLREAGIPVCECSCHLLGVCIDCKCDED